MVRGSTASCYACDCAAWSSRLCGDLGAFLDSPLIEFLCLDGLSAAVWSLGAASSVQLFHGGHVAAQFASHNFHRVFTDRLIDSDQLSVVDTIAQPWWHGADHIAV